MAGEMKSPSRSELIFRLGPKVGFFRRGANIPRTVIQSESSAGVSDALSDGVPSRDLLLSPDHAILVDDMLIQAGALINGSSIVRESKVAEAFTYYHIDLADHSLIFAENTPAETFVDNIDRMAFDNWDEYEALYPDGKSVTEMAYPRAKAHRQVPRVIRERIAARAALLGFDCVVAA
jgi:Hint domain